MSGIWLSRAFEFLEGVSATMFSNPERKYYLHLKIWDHWEKERLIWKIRRLNECSVIKGNIREITSWIMPRVWEYIKFYFHMESGDGPKSS